MDVWLKNNDEVRFVWLMIVGEGGAFLIYLVRSKMETLFPTGLIMELPSGVNTTFPPL